MLKLYLTEPSSFAPNDLHEKAFFGFWPKTGAPKFLLPRSSTRWRTSASSRTPSRWAKTSSWAFADWQKILSGDLTSGLSR